MFTAKVYNVMVGSLSGIMEEVIFAKEVICKWNKQNAERCGEVFLTVDWTTNPEEIQKADVVIAVVGNWIQNTDTIEECLRAGKKPIILFNAFQDPKYTIAREHDSVKMFRERMQGRCNCVEFGSLSDLKQMVEEVLLEQKL